MNHKLKVFSWIAVGTIVGALTVVSLQTVAKDTRSDLPLAQLQELSKAFDIVKKVYVKPVDNKKLITDAISGMVSGLDPHSQYFDSKGVEVFKEAVSGSFSGVGMQIADKDGLVQVVAPIDDSPAQRAGVRSGDYITRVDGKDARGSSTSEVVQWIRGETGTPVHIVFFRKDENRSIPVTLIRSEIKTSSVRAKLIEPNYVWVRVSQFQERTVEEFVQAMKDLYTEDPDIKGIVLDLRNDPGGLLNAAIGLSAVFLPKDATVVSTKGQAPGTNAVLRARAQDYLRCGTPCMTPDPLDNAPAALKTVPLVILVNNGSASASEIVAGALQDHHRGVVMGEQTFGKGSVQTTVNLGKDSLIKLTTAYYYTPSGKSIQSVGVVPDVFVDSIEGGDPFKVLQRREANIRNHLNNPTNQEKTTDFDLAAELERSKVLRQLEEDLRKKAENRSIPELGSDKDFALRQALNLLQNKIVVASTTLNPRPSEEAGKASKDKSEKVQ